jgi:protein involved in temperature-dependent protein secretion
MPPQELNQQIDQVFATPGAIQSAAAAGVRDAPRRYAQAGELMAVLKDGRVAWIDPVTRQEIPVPNHSAPLP